jgi:hypothetical protein
MKYLRCKYKFELTEKLKEYLTSQWHFHSWFYSFNVNSISYKFLTIFNTIVDGIFSLFPFVAFLI